MAETTRMRINGYLGDAIAEEQAAIDQARRFQSAAPDGATRALFDRLAELSAGQEQQLTALLRQRGGAPSTPKAVLARLLSTSAMAPQIGEPNEEKAARHVGMAVAAASTHAAMYEALATSAGVTRDDDVAALAQKMQSQEQAIRDEWAASERQILAPLLEHEIARSKCAADIVAAYLDDAIATERSIESQLRAFAKEAEDQPGGRLLTDYADETRSQFEQLTRRLQSLGKEPSLLRGFLSQVFNFAPKVAQLGYGPEERVAQHLIAAYGFVNAEAAMFTALSVLAETTGDTATAALASGIQQQKHAMMPRIWKEIAPAAEVSTGTMPYATNHDRGTC